MARIQQLAEGRFVFEGRGWVARVTELASSWQLELTHGEHRRDIAAPSCAALAEAAAVAIVLSEPPGVNGGTPPVPAPPVPALPTPSEPGVASPSPPAPDVPLIERTAQSASVDWSKASPSAKPRDAEPPEPRGSEPPEPRQPERPLGRPTEQHPVTATNSSARDMSWYVAATGLWDSSLIPGGSFGAQLGAGYQWAPRQRAVALVLLLAPQRTPLDTPSDAAVDYTYAAGTVRACQGFATRLVLEGCAGVEVGAVNAKTFGFAEGQSQRSLFPSFVATVGGGAALGPVQLRFASEGIVPLLRDRFTADRGALLVHETPRLSVRLGAGILWPF